MPPPRDAARCDPPWPSSRRCSPYPPDVPPWDLIPPRARTGEVRDDVQPDCATCPRRRAMPGSRPDSPGSSACRRPAVRGARPSSSCPCSPVCSSPTRSATSSSATGSTARPDRHGHRAARPRLAFARAWAARSGRRCSAGWTRPRPERSASSSGWPRSSSRCSWPCASRGCSRATLAVGGAFTAVVFGLAAQQTLGNVIAGTVLLSARPFRVGERDPAAGRRRGRQRRGRRLVARPPLPDAGVGRGPDHGPELRGVERRGHAAARARRGQPARPPARGHATERPAGRPRDLAHRGHPLGAGHRARSRSTTTRSSSGSARRRSARPTARSSPTRSSPPSGA